MVWVDMPAQHRRWLPERERVQKLPGRHEDFMYICGWPSLTLFGSLASDHNFQLLMVYCVYT